MLKIKKALKTNIVFILIIILGFMLRAQGEISGNFLFLMDQGRDDQTQVCKAFFKGQRRIPGNPSDVVDDNYRCNLLLQFNIFF